MVLGHPCSRVLTIMGLTQLAFRSGLLVLAACLPALAGGQSQSAFVHVNVIPMDRERVLRDQTVLIKGGTIQGMGSNLPVPAGTRAIDGHGTAFLSPGLADMHTHSE